MCSVNPVNSWDGKTQQEFKEKQFQWDYKVNRSNYMDILSSFELKLAL